MSSIQATFCDDIRHEIGGKVSLIGCYANHLFSEGFPLTAPKLCVHLRILTDPLFEPTPFSAVITDSEGKEILRLRTTLTPENKTQDYSSPGEQQEILAGLEMPGLKIDGPTTLFVQAEIGGEVLSGPLLHVSLSPEAEAKQ
tara:strand:+ start:1214 stop:1639 length:426 start_codon:yes stop_codon:yes gene_type:complete